jgi:hypothetical protein
VTTDSLVEKIDICLELRSSVAAGLAKILTGSPRGCSETDVHDQIKKLLEDNSSTLNSGWYVPPPSGIGVLFANKEDAYARSRFPTLRTEPYWPSGKFNLEDETVGMAYVSPVHKASGIIADIGLNYYTGSNKDIQQHLKKCLTTVESIAEQAETGMKFKELHAKATKVLEDSGLHNGWMQTFNDPLRGPNFGHTFPWTNVAPSAEEQNIINSSDVDKITSLISSKRKYVNSIEDFVIPDNIAFSIEARLGDHSRPKLPGGYYYALVTFQQGQKKIVTNYNVIFDSLGIKYMRSKY